MKTVNCHISRLCFAGVLALTATMTHAGPFDEGATRVSIVLGSGSAFGDRYTVVGGGIDYMLTDRLQLGVDAQFWRGAEPAVTKLSPHLDLVMNVQGIRPYAGVFYRQTWVEDLEDLASAGGRIGVWLTQGSSAHVGVGYVYERYLDCEVSTFEDCEDSYPEVVLTFSFGR